MLPEPARKHKLERSPSGKKHREGVFGALSGVAVPVCVLRPAESDTRFQILMLKPFILTGN